MDTQRIGDWRLVYIVLSEYSERLPHEPPPIVQGWKFRGRCRGFHCAVVQNCDCIASRLSLLGVLTKITPFVNHGNDIYEVGGDLTHILDGTL